MTTLAPTPTAAESDRLPIGSLVALFAAGFITIMTEAMPAGLLTDMSRQLGVTESLTGQTVTIYALGSAATAIPLTIATATWNRKRILLIALIGFVIANVITAASTNFTVTMGARFLAGVAAGLVWSILAGYAQSLVVPRIKGRATAIAMAGTPVALAMGVPLGTALGLAVGWRAAFFSVAVAATLLIAWALRKLPQGAATGARRRISPAQALAIPGIKPILLVVAGVVTAHNVLYTYIAPILAGSSFGGGPEWILLIFGLASIASIIITAATIDRHQRFLVLASISVFAASAAVLAWNSSATAVVIATIGWGLAFGGIATLLLTAAAQAAGPAADIATSFVVTTWNIAIAAGGILGGLILVAPGVGALSWSALVLLIPTVLVAATARRYAFPRTR